MSLAEIKHSITELTIEERLDLAAWIAHLNRAEDHAHLAELDARMSAMDGGSKVSSAEFERVHSELCAKGK